MPSRVPGVRDMVQAHPTAGGHGVQCGSRGCAASHAVARRWASVIWAFIGVPMVNNEDSEDRAGLVPDPNRDRTRGVGTRLIVLHLPIQKYLIRRGRFLRPANAMHPFEDRLRKPAVKRGIRGQDS